MNYKIYIDLDGVLVDFLKQVEDNIPGISRNGYDWIKITPKMWSQIKKLGTDFWSEMEWMPGASRLWQYIKKFRPTILSAPVNTAACRQGKGIWVRRELGNNVEYILDSKKEKYAKPNAILIDDRLQNIKRWESAGGIGILHKDVEDTITQLKKILNNKITFKDYYERPKR